MAIPLDGDGGGDGCFVFGWEQQQEAPAAAASASSSSLVGSAAKLQKLRFVAGWGILRIYFYSFFLLYPLFLFLFDIHR